MKTSRWAFAVAVLAVAGSGCKEELPPAEPMLRSVRYMMVESSNDERERTFSGKVRAGNQSRLSFQVNGRVKEVFVKVGETVKQGDKIAELDATDFEIQLQEARASAAQARAQSDGAAAAYARVRALYERRNASTQDLDNARAQRDSTRSVLAAATQTIKRLQRQRGYATLTALGDGTVSEVTIEANEVVAPGQVIGVLQVGEQLEVGVDLPESYIRRVEQGASVSVTFSAVPGEVMQGTVHEVGVPAAGAPLFPVTVRLDDGAGEKVRSGLVAQVTFALEEAAGAAPHRHLPLTAVGEDREGRFVYVVEKGDGDTGSVQRRGVEVGEIEGETIEVLTGVKDGEFVVTLGVNRIHDGLQVKVPPL